MNCPAIIKFNYTLVLDYTYWIEDCQLDTVAGGPFHTVDILQGDA